MEDDVDIREKVFHNLVREYIIGFLAFLILSFLSYCVLCAYKRRSDRDEYSIAYEDAFVYKVSILSCTFALTVSFGAVMLLPVSIVANEAILNFPNSYYLQWVNSSLIYSLWNTIFVSSNLSLFVFMPFAYLFTESEGLPGSKRGIMPRVYETSLVFVLLCVAVCGLAWIVLALTSGEQLSFIFEVIFDVKNFSMLYLYSCVSFVGVAMLLLCTPVGFTRLFSVIGELIRRPNYFKEDFEEDLDSALLEEISFSEKLKKKCKKNELLKRPTSLMLSEDEDDCSSNFCNNDVSSSNHSSISTSSILKTSPTSFHHPDSPDSPKTNGFLIRHKSTSSFSSLFGSPSTLIFRSHSLKSNLSPVTKPRPPYSPAVSKYMQRRLDLEQKRKKIYIRRKFFYPLAMISLLLLMSITLLMVFCNIAELMITGKVFRTKSKKEDMVLGGSSLSSFGLVGSLLEVAVIFYLMLTSIVGVYSLPGFKRLQPQRSNTRMTIVIANCIMILVLSSALPVLSRTLGLTNFDLLGNYGQLEWLGNCSIIFIYNLVFLVVSAFCLSRHASVYMGLTSDGGKEVIPSSILPQPAPTT